MMKRLSVHEAFARTAPLVYTVVTCLDAGGKPNALGVSWVMRVSFDPFLVAIAIDHSRYSHEGIRKNREFTVNYPAPGQEKGAWACGTASGRSSDKIAASGLPFIPSEKVRPPAIDGAAVTFECRVVGELEAGDHTIFVGEVVAARGSPAGGRHLYATAGMELVALGRDAGE